MKVTYHWLKEFASIGASPEELAAQLTMAGLEVESLSPVVPPFSGVVVGQVLEAGRHPNAEKLSLCQVTTDGENRLQIVCGAKNVRAGLKVAVAMVGAKLPNDVLIERAMLRGQESNGMLCSARELGLGDEHDGIMELGDSLPLNQNVREALDLDDYVLDVNATPNRGDCMSVFGIARDYSAARERRVSRVARIAGVPGVRISCHSRRDAERGVSRVVARAFAPGWYQQHFSDRRCHQLRHDRVGTTHACLRCGQADSGHFGSNGQASRTHHIAGRQRIRT